MRPGDLDGRSSSCECGQKHEDFVNVKRRSQEHRPRGFGAELPLLRGTRTGTWYLRIILGSK